MRLPRLNRSGSVSPHDLLAHDPERSRSPHPRRGMTLRYMPAISMFGRELAGEKGIQGLMLLAPRS